MKPTEIFPGLWLFQDTCNVYVSKREDEAIAIDFGSGEWLSSLPGLGIKKLQHVFLTHHHADQCEGLLARDDWPFTVHAPAGEQAFLSPEGVEQFHSIPRFGRGCPTSYSVLPRGISGVQYDMAGFSNFFWGPDRMRFVHTPGHGPNACSIVLDHGRKQVVFCGDAAHAGATLWQPYHLEWDHWTGTGALAAWEGIRRLHGLAIDIMCPAHGPVITENPRQTLKALDKRLMRFYEAKGQISPGEPDNYKISGSMECGARQILPNLYQFGCNGYLLISRFGDGLVVDPYSADMSDLEALLDELGGVRPTAVTATHYHLDHCDAIPYLKEKYDPQIWLHPRVAEPLRNPAEWKLPWLPSQPIEPDYPWDETGEFVWRDYEFRVAPWPGQTWWHCVFMTQIDDSNVLFGGDSFQPSSRWNGTGGFCAFNNSRFTEGFIPSAELVIEWKPDIIAAGHGAYYYYSPSKFRKIIKWARFAEEATRALCPSGDLEKDYYSVHRSMP